MVLSFRRARILFWVPIGLAHIALPLAVVTAYMESKETALSTYSALMQIFLPIGAVLWAMAYLQIPFDSAGKETLCSCKRGKRTCLLDIWLIIIGFLIMLIPNMMIATAVFGFLWPEYIRLMVEICFSVSAVYVLTVLCSSVTMGGMVIILYLLFCTICSGTASMEMFSVLEMNVLANVQGLTSKYLLIEGGAIALLLLGHCLENRNVQRFR